MSVRIATLAIAGLSALLLGGCAGGTYQTNASDTQLSAYAGQATYPRDINPIESPHIFCSVAPDATITLYNAGDESYAGFELWVNQLYTLHIEKLDARSTLPISPNTVYNKTGTNLGGVPASSINTVQIFFQGKLYNVQGPILPH